MIEDAEELVDLFPLPAGVFNVFEALFFDLVGHFVQTGKTILGGRGAFSKFLVERQAHLTNAGEDLEPGQEKP